MHIYIYIHIYIRTAFNVACFMIQPRQKVRAGLCYISSHMTLLSSHVHPSFWFDWLGQTHCTGTQLGNHPLSDHVIPN